MKADGKLAMMILLSSFVLVWPAVATAQPTELEYTVVNSFSTLYDQTGPDPLSWGINGTDGIAWDGSGIWMTGCGESRVGKLDEDGLLVDELSLPDVAGSDHIAWDGQYLWAVVHSMPNSTGPLDSRLIQIDTSAGAIINTLSLPWGDRSVMAPMGLAWDGQNLWTHHPGTKEIYRINAETGEGKDQPVFLAPSINGSQLSPCGISWDEHSCLWISDLDKGAYYQVVPETGEIVSYLVPPDNPDPTKYGSFRPAHVTKLFTGMTTDGNRVWIVDELEGNPLIYELDVAFPTTGPCAHPVGLGESCVPGGQPLCEAEDLCYGQPGAEWCHLACDRSDPSCPTGSTCWTQPDVGDVCIPAGDHGGFGQACVTARDCQSARCVDGLCSDTCGPGAMLNSCPSGFSCGDLEGDSVCLKDPAPRKGGCSVSSSSSWPSLFGFALLLIGWLIWLRRRRRAR